MSRVFAYVVLTVRNNRETEKQDTHDASVVFFGFSEVVNWCWIFTFSLEGRRWHIGTGPTS